MFKTWLKALGNGERYQTICFIAIIILLFFVLSCNSTTRSLQNPDLKVNRDELIAEFDFLSAQMAIRIKDLDKQDAFKQMLTDQAALVSSGGSINPAGLITTVAALFGFGAVIDNVRKRKVIKTNTSDSVKD